MVSEPLVRPVNSAREKMRDDIIAPSITVTA
jgi:hypothetical protein